MESYKKTVTENTEYGKETDGGATQYQYNEAEHQGHDHHNFGRETRTETDTPYEHEHVCGGKGY